MTIPILEACPFCEVILLSPAEAKNAESGEVGFCPKCSACLDEDRLTTFTLIYPKLLSAYIDFLKATGWKITPPEENSFWSSATLGLAEMTERRRQMSLDAVEDPQIQASLREALDPQSASIRAFNALAAQGKILTLTEPGHS